MSRARLLAATALALGSATLLHAQGAPQARLESARTEAARAERRAAEFQRAAQQERDDAAKARAEEAAAASRIEAAQASIAAAQARIAVVDSELRQQRVRLAERQGAVINLVAALQSMARRPAVLALAQPGSLSDLVHVRAVLGATLPVVEARTADVRRDLERTRATRAQGAAAVRALHEGRTKLEGERLALIKLEAEHRLRSRDLGRTALYESDRALALGESARDIVDQMQEQASAADTAAALASLGGPLPRPAALATAPPASAAPPYRLPVAGTIVSGLGEVSETGVRARGLTFATPGSAPIIAPAPGKVVYAAAFRNYGRVVIVDHGNGWTSLIAGLDRLAVRSGDTLTQGAPLGTAPAGDQARITVELRRRGIPVDLTALLD